MIPAILWSERMGTEESLEGTRSAGTVPLGTRIRQFAGLGFTILLAILCLWQLPAAWLNFRHVIDPERVPRQLVDVEVAGRGVFSITFRYVLKLPDGRDVPGSASAGLVARSQYDDLAAEAERAGGKPQFEVVYDAREPTHGRLRGRMGGVPTLAVLVFCLLYGAWEVRKIVLSYRRVGPAPRGRLTA
jgi:hypothetical protein